MKEGLYVGPGYRSKVMSEAAISYPITMMSYPRHYLSVIKAYSAHNFIPSKVTTTTGRASLASVALLPWMDAPIRREVIITAWQLIIYFIFMYVHLCKYWHGGREYWTCVGCHAFSLFSVSDPSGFVTVDVEE